MHWHWVYITSILYIVPDLYMLCYVRILFGLVLQLGPLATCVQADDKSLGAWASTGIFFNGVSTITAQAQHHVDFVFVEGAEPMNLLK